MQNNLKQLFLLDPQVIFLNHGSFGACPRPVFEIYQTWQRKLEHQPVLFLGREFTEYDQQARQALGGYLHTAADDLVYIPNATHGVNIVARSLELYPGDEILASDHEYGACDYTWEFICNKTGALYIHQPIPLLAATPDELVNKFWAGVTQHTKVIFLSHISSPTALRFPVEAICQKARESGILTVIDGAHAPGQIQLDLEEISADFYTGNCHKWMMAPKGSAFLYARQQVQLMIEPLIVSWGYHSIETTTTGSRFIDYLGYTGTKDPAAALTVPAAIEFMQEYDWDTVGKYCHQLTSQAVDRICTLVGLPSLYTDPKTQFRQMAIAPLPPINEFAVLKSRLYNEYKIEIPLIEWNDRQFIRISVQGYNTQTDIDKLIAALEKLLPDFHL